MAISLRSVNSILSDLLRMRNLWAYTVDHKPYCVTNVLHFQIVMHNRHLPFFLALYETFYKFIADNGQKQMQKHRQKLQQQ